MVNVGDSAPVFSAKLSTGEGIEEFDLQNEIGKGNVVLAFLFGAFTPVCTTEMCDFTSSLKEFEDMKAKVYGVSVDTPFSQNAFIKQNNISTPMISDFNREAVEKYGVKYDEFKGFRGIAKRSVFIIDKQGKIAYVWVTEDPSVPPKMDEIKEALKKLA